MAMASLNQGQAIESSKTQVLPGMIQCRRFESASDQIKKVLNPQGQFSGEWDTIFLLISVIAVSLDPLFFYLPVVHEDQKCLFMDTKLGIAASVLRSIMDVLLIISVASRVLFPRSRGGNEEGNSTRSKRKKERGNSNSPSTDASSCIAIFREYFPSLLFLVDIIAVLPLPQVVVLVIIPKMRDASFTGAIELLTIVVICQSIPRILRIYPFYKIDKRASATLAEATWAKAAFNFFLYMLAGYALGSLWYILAIERETTCWRKACESHLGCGSRSFYCNDSVGDHTFINDNCPITTPNPKLFDFGIFLDALQSGVLEVVNFPQKLFHCFRWGLQNLSCFGQNLRTSTWIWENCFALFITVSGLLLFLSLIGNVQIYLQTKTMKLEEMRLRSREIEEWKPFKKLSPQLKKQIKQYQKYKWQESRGVDVENLLSKYPKEMIKNFKRELCLELLKKVKDFSNLGKRVLNDLCYHAKPVLFIENSYIRKEGDPIDEMLFIVKGNLITYSSTSNEETGRLEDGDFCGEELLQKWLYCQYQHSTSLPLPTSEKNIKALSKVEAFALLADDLKRSVYVWAARQIQLAYLKRKQKGHNRSHHLHIKIDGSYSISASVKTSICASTPDNTVTVGTPQLNVVHYSDQSARRPMPLAIREEDKQ